ncbi:MAG: DNA translocase FtsK 4TM domain-containing protein, partial [Anaerolineae bacterium]|nr:DNA translocase FtsK 4TM domain-containing protein [Anaerolineae bacterium]
MTKRSASSGSRRSTTSTPAKKKPAAKGRPASRSRGASKRKPSEPLIKLTPDQKLDLLGGFLIFFALLTLLSLLSAQQGTLTGIWISFLSLLFGWGMYVVPVFIGAVGLWLILRRFEDRIPWPETEQLVGIMLGFFVALMTMHMVVHLLEPQVDLYALQDELPGGGLVGAVMLDAGLDALGPAGVTITLVLAWLVVGTFTAGISPADIIERLVEGPKAPVINTTANQRTQLPLPDESLRVTGPLEGEDEDWDGPVDWDSSPEEVSPLQKSRRGRKQKEDVGQGSPDEVKIHVASRSANGKADRNGSLDNLNIRDPNLSSASSQIWRLPVIGDILKPGSEQTYSEDLIRKQVHIIENTLESLGAPVRVREINQGPVITQFGAEPLFLTNRSGKTTKVKVSKIANLADDLALALSARSIRIEAPIPGKGLVGIEVPNEEPAVVSLLDTMESERFAKLKGRLRIGLGQDVSGQAVAADLRLMPHLLIAGATGAGKSVCVNAVIAALLLQNTPDT